MDRVLMEEAAIRSFVAGRGGSQEEQDKLARDLFDAVDATRKAESLADAQTAAEEIHNAEIVAAGLDKPGDWAGHPTPPILEAATRKDATEGAKEGDEELVQEGMEMYLKIEEAIEIHAKLEDAILIDIIGTRVFMAQLKGVLVDLRKDVIGA